MQAVVRLLVPILTVCNDGGTVSMSSGKGDVQSVLECLANDVSDDLDKGQTENQ